MCISGLKVSESGFRYDDRESFPRRRGYNFTFQFFEDFNEELMCREQKEEALWWNVGKHR